MTSGPSTLEHVAKRSRANGSATECKLWGTRDADIRVMRHHYKEVVIVIEDGHDSLHESGRVLRKLLELRRLTKEVGDRSTVSL